MVICGSRRSYFENPGSRNPSPASVSKYKVLTSYRTRLALPSRACAAHAADGLCRHPLRIFAQPPVERRIRRRRQPGLLQHLQGIELAGRLDDPGQHQLAERLVPARRAAKAQHLISPTQHIMQVTHPR
jgi:hypothetical protein